MIGESCSIVFFFFTREIMKKRGLKGRENSIMEFVLMIKKGFAKYSQLCNERIMKKKPQQMIKKRHRWEK